MADAAGRCPAPSAAAVAPTVLRSTRAPAVAARPLRRRVSAWVEAASRAVGIIVGATAPRLALADPPRLDPRSAEEADDDGAVRGGDDSGTVADKEAAAAVPAALVGDVGEVEESAAASKVATEGLCHLAALLMLPRVWLTPAPAPGPRAVVSRKPAPAVVLGRSLPMVSEAMSSTALVPGPPL